MHWINYILLAIALFYVAGIAVIRATMKLRSDDIETVDASAMPKEIVASLVEKSQAFVECGFTHVAFLRVAGQMAMVSMYVSMWQRRDRGQTACVGVVLPSVGRHDWFVQFLTAAIHPLRVVVTTTSKPGVFDDMGWRIIQYFPSVEDAHDLYRVHLRREADVLCSNDVRYLPSPANVAAAENSESRFEIRDQCRRGLFYESSEPGVFRPTWYGATIMVLRLLPPLRQVRILRSRLTSKRDIRRALSAPVNPPSNVVVTEQSPVETQLAANRLSYA